MCTFPIFLIFCLSVSQTILEEGYFFYLKSDNGPTFIRLGFENEKLVANKKSDAIQNCDSGALWSAEYQKFLGINKSGQLQLSLQRDLDFSVKETRDSGKCIKPLKYRGNELFQLCADNSIRFESDCIVVSEIRIHYEKNLSYDLRPKSATKSVEGYQTCD